MYTVCSTYYVRTTLCNGIAVQCTMYSVTIHYTSNAVYCMALASRTPVRVPRTPVRVRRTSVRVWRTYVHCTSCTRQVC